MTDIEINIAIAESVGYEKRVTIRGSSKRFLFRIGDGAWMTSKFLPKYSSSLDEIHKAFKKLGIVQQIEWHHHLYEIVRKACAQNLEEESVRMVAVNADAKQRCQAYLKTIGKWKE